MAKSGVCDICKRGFFEEPCGPEHEAGAQRLRAALVAVLERHKEEESS